MLLFNRTFVFLFIFSFLTLAQNYTLNEKDFDKAISFEHSNYQQSKAVSKEIDLKIGQLYRLSATIKTVNAFTESDKQYPTPVPACLSMESFPFTNHSPAVGASLEKKVEVVFIATEKKDKVHLNFGFNGGAKGSASFSNIKIEEVTNISEYIPLESVKWYGDAFRFEDKGWVFVHIEGEPYNRGVQYGYLVAEEVKEFLIKYATKKNTSNPEVGWNDVRFAADALFFRKYDEEYLTEMKGIADGVNKAGVTIFNRPVEALDIVALNSTIDIDYSADAVQTTGSALTGRSFLSQEDELTLPDKLHKCSAFLATKSATESNRIVYGQIFMWNGYMGPHWNLIVDVQPSKGHRLVYQTFPGGIHSGTDFYINDAGIMLGETTVMQTPFNPDGTPQSNRIRKAAQYASSIDDVVKIMTEKNNGLYTNDWLIGDTKTDEIAILNLGTTKYKLWRSSKSDWYNGQKDWYFSNNNNKSLDVRKEYIVNNSNSPYDLSFRPMNRDIAFWNFYKEKYGKIDANDGINLWNSSPINRPHACDGKITTSEMVENLMFFANSGKVTQREMFVGENGRIPDMYGSVPRLSLGYSVIAPKLFVDKLKEVKNKAAATSKAIKEKQLIDAEVKEVYSYDKNKLWINTVYPKTEKENWFISGTAAYWSMLKAAPQKNQIDFFKNELGELNARLNYVFNTEGSIKAYDGRTDYSGYKYYQIPRIKGTYLLHQLRLQMGNEKFGNAINKIHNEYREKDITSSEVQKVFEQTADKDLDKIFNTWLNDESIPEVTFETDYADGKLNVKVNQSTNYLLNSSIAIVTEKDKIVKPIQIKEGINNYQFDAAEKPIEVILNYSNDFPVKTEKYFTFSNFTDEFSKTLIVYGSNRQNEANHTLALRFQKMAADRFTEILLPVKKDVELSEEELSNSDLVVLGSPEDNNLTKDLIVKLNIKAGKNIFELNGKVYGNSDEGMVIVQPNPYNNKKAVYIFISNSSLQLYNMIKTLNRIPSYAVFKKDQIIDKGYFHPALLTK